MELPEAPASVTYSVISKDGFYILFTIRNEVKPFLLRKISYIETRLIEIQYKPHIKPGFGKIEKAYVGGKVYPKCGGRLVNKYTRGGENITNAKMENSTQPQDNPCAVLL